MDSESFNRSSNFNRGVEGGFDNMRAQPVATQSAETQPAEVRSAEVQTVESSLGNGEYNSEVEYGRVTEYSAPAENVVASSPAPASNPFKAVPSAEPASSNQALTVRRKKSNKRLIAGLALVFSATVIALVAILMMTNSGNNDVTTAESQTEVSSSEIKAEVEPETTIISDSIEGVAAGSAIVVIDGKAVTYNAAYLIDGAEVTLTSGSYASTEDNQNVFLVINGGKLKIDGEVKITKTGAADFDGRGDEYSFYGINSAIVVAGAGSEAVINGATITTNTAGANAVVATDSGTVTVANTVISTTKDGSRGLHATYQGLVTAEKVVISTLGGSSATLATDRGEGTIEASEMELTTAGVGSPLIYSTGKISVSDSSGTATGAQIAVIEGKNSVVLTDCDFTTYGIGNRNDVDNAAVMIYQSMSGDAGVGTGSFVATDCNLTVSPDSPIYKTVPFFFVTNTDATINLTDVKANFASASVFISAAGTSEWGKAGANGGHVTIQATDLAASNVVKSVDNISSISGI